MDEKAIQNIINEDDSIKKSLFELLNVNNSPHLQREQVFNNGITVDFMVLEDTEIKSLVEVKQKEINITDIVRGIGQVYQYEHFYNSDSLPRNNKELSYTNEGFSTTLLIPSDFITSTSYALGDLRYPETTKIIEINTTNYKLREITRNELKSYISKDSKNTISVCQYYVRDNRLYEIYILLKYLLKEKSCEKHFANRIEVEKKLQQLGVKNNKNWRNAFISLSLFGFIDSKNLPTTVGVHMAHKSFEAFASEIYEAYIRPFVDILFSLEENGKIEGTNIRLAKNIRERYNGNDVLFLTQSNGRYISSFLNILRDDYGALEYEPRSSSRRIKYNISEVKYEVLEKKVKENPIPYFYINKYIKLVKEGKL